MFGSKNVMPWPRFVASPPAAPGGCRKPPGKDSSDWRRRSVRYRAIGTRSVDCVKPVWLTFTLTTPSASKKIP